MGNHPSQTVNNSRPVGRVPAQPRPELTPTTPGYKQRPAPRPPARVPSYKNPHCLVLPREVPNGILRNRDEVTIPVVDYYSDEDQDADSELDEPNEQFSVISNTSTNGRITTVAGSTARNQLRKGNYTPNGEIITDGRVESRTFEPERGVNRPLSGYYNTATDQRMLDYDNRRVPNRNSARIQELQKSSPRGSSKDSPRDIRGEHSRFSTAGNSYAEISGRNNNEQRVTFAASQSQPALGEVVRPIVRRQKGRAPPPPRPPPPNVQPTLPPPAPTPPVVLPMKEPNSADRLTKPRPSLHEQLQADIINAAKARQGRDLVEPPKIEKPKSGEEKFRDELIKVCKKIESYPGDDTDVEGHTTGRESEWETTYDPNDYKPRTNPKFLVKTNNTRFNNKRGKQQSDSPVSRPSQKSTKPQNSKSPEPQKSTDNPRVARDRSQSIDSVLGGSISLIPTIVESRKQDEWTPDQDLKEDDMDDTQPTVANLEEKLNSESAIYGPGMRMNMSESSMGSVRMYRRKSADQSEKPSRFHKHRNSDGSVRSKGSVRSLKDSIRSAFSSIGTSTKNRKERKTVKGYFEQNGYHYGPNITPVMYYHPNDSHYYYQRGYYPMAYPGQVPTSSTLSPTVPPGPGWYEDPYRMYPPRPVPIQPILITDGMNRRAVSMEELEYPSPFGPMPMYIDPQTRGKTRGNKSKRPSEYTGSWSSLKDDIQYDHGSISRSWRRMKARARGRSKSRESLEDWNIERMEDNSDSSDDEHSVAPLPGRGGTMNEASRRYQEVMERGVSRRRVHDKKNGALGSSSDENKPPTKLLRSQEGPGALPPSGQKYRSRYRKKAGDDVEL